MARSVIRSKRLSVDNPEQLHSWGKCTTADFFAFVWSPMLATFPLCYGLLEAFENQVEGGFRTPVPHHRPVQRGF